MIAAIVVFMVSFTVILSAMIAYVHPVQNHPDIEPRIAAVASALITLVYLVSQ